MQKFLKPSSLLTYILTTLLHSDPTLGYPTDKPPTANLTLFPGVSCTPDKLQSTLYAHSSICTSFSYPAIHSLVNNGILNIQAISHSPHLDFHTNADKSLADEKGVEEVGSRCVLRVYADYDCGGLLAGEHAFGSCVMPREILGGRESGVRSVRLDCA